MFETIMQNQELIVSVLAMLLTWLIAIIFKKAVEKSKLVAALMMILDICQDIKNKAPDATPEAKKKQAVMKVESLLPPKKVSLVKKVFGNVGSAVEFVWKNRKTLITATAILLKKVF